MYETRHGCGECCSRGLDGGHKNDRYINPASVRVGSSCRLKSYPCSFIILMEYPADGFLFVLMFTNPASSCLLPQPLSYLLHALPCMWFLSSLSPSTVVVGRIPRLDL